MSVWTVVLRFSVLTTEVTDFRSRAMATARLLAAADGCQGVEVGRASDAPSMWMLAIRWDSVGAYRRALGSHQVKAEGMPFLSTAIDEPTAFEVLFASDVRGERSAPGDLASDAATVDRSR